MSISRRNRRALDKHLNKLGIILSRFYDFLSKSDKPSDEEVRNKFIEYEKEWLSYCLKKHLSPLLHSEFKHQVSEAWKHKQTEQ